MTRRRCNRACLVLLLLAVCVAGCGDDGEGAGMQRPEKTFGVIEGFYGPPYSFEQRLDLLRFLPEAGMNAYVYAPKSDPYHRDRWRDPYPPDFVEHFRDLTAAGRQAGVRFIFAVSPGASFDPADGDRAALEAKLAAMFGAGVRDFCIFFDDLDPESPAADAAVQAAIVNGALAFLRSLDAGNTLRFISHYYAGTAAEIGNDTAPFNGLFAQRSSAAYAAYAAIDPGIAIFWTGPRVFSRISMADASGYRALAARPVLIWDNYPVNDVVLTRELFLAPYHDREAGVVSIVDGVLLNTMLQPQASKIALWTAGRFFADGEGYDPEAALAEALEVVGGSAAAGRVLARVAGQFRSHPLIGSERESPELADRVEAFFTFRSAAAEADLRQLFREFASAADDLDRDVMNRALVAELAEPAGKLSLLGRAGLVALDLLAAKRSGAPVDASQLDALLAQAGAIPWLVGANTQVPAGLDLFLAGRPTLHADVFGGFFARVRAELRGGP